LRFLLLPIFQVLLKMITNRWGNILGILAAATLVDVILWITPLRSTLFSTVAARLMGLAALMVLALIGTFSWSHAAESVP